MKIHTASNTVYSDICYNSEKRVETDIRKYIFAVSKLPTSEMCYPLISKKQQHLTLSIKNLYVMLNRLSFWYI